MKTEWKQLVCNSNLMQAETDRAILIKLPKSELKFWHPSKLVRTSGKSGYRMTIAYTDSFVFKCFRNGKGRYNSHEKIEECEFNSKEIEEIFGKTQQSEKTEE